MGVDCAPAYAWPSSVQGSRLVSTDWDACLHATPEVAPLGPLGLAASELLGAHFRRCTAACRISVCLWRGRSAGRVVVALWERVLPLRSGELAAGHGAGVPCP